MHEHMTKQLDSEKETGIKGRTKDSEGDGGLDAGREEPVGSADWPRSISERQVAQAAAGGALPPRASPECLCNVTLDLAVTPLLTWPHLAEEDHVAVMLFRIVNQLECADISRRRPCWRGGGKCAKCRVVFARLCVVSRVMPNFLHSSEYHVLDNVILSFSSFCHITYPVIRWYFVKICKKKWQFGFKISQ